MNYIIRISFLILLGIAFIIMWNLKMVGVPKSFKLPQLILVQESEYQIFDQAQDSAGSELHQVYRAGQFDYFEIRSKSKTDTAWSSGFRLVTDTSGRLIWSHFEIFRKDTSRWTGNDTSLSNGLYSSFQPGLLRYRNKILEEFGDEAKIELPDTFLTDTRLLSNWNHYLKGGFPGPGPMLFLDISPDSLKYVSPVFVTTGWSERNDSAVFSIQESQSGRQILKFEKSRRGKSFSKIADLRTGRIAVRKYTRFFEYHDAEPLRQEDLKEIR